MAEQEYLIGFGSIQDIPAKTDKFGIGRYIEGLSQFILNCETPMTVAIQGDWGTGKTSIMKQVEDKLEESSKNIETVFFNTWQYSQFNQESELGVSLITELTSQLPLYDEKEITEKALAVLKGFGYKAASRLLSKVSFGGVELDDLKKSIEEVRGESVTVDNLRDLKDRFQELVNQIKKDKSVDRVVIFIDDLDRLVPAKAVELLEVLKLFLDCEGCVFVLAIDYNVVVRGVKAKYGNDIDSEKGNAFFEKIIQVPFTVPVENYDMSEFIKKSLSEMRVIDLSRDEIKGVVDLISYSIGHNPRSIKRLFNSYSLLLYVVAESTWKNQDKILLFALLCLQKSYPELYLNLVQQDIESLEKVLEKIRVNDEESLMVELELNGDESFELTNDFRSFIEIFNEIVDQNNIQSIYDKLKVSNTVASGNTDVQNSGDKTSFWEGFSNYIKENDKELLLTHNIPSGKVSSYYTISENSNDKDRVFCEFSAGNNTVGLIYGKKTDKSFYDMLLKNLDNLQKVTKLELDPRKWNEKNKSNVQGLKVRFKEFGLNYTEKNEEAYKMLIDSFKVLDAEVKKLNK